MKISAPYIYIFLLANILFICNVGFAQQSPFLVSPVYNPVDYNPAALGEDAKLTLIYRHQWFLDIEKAPRTLSLNADFSKLTPFANRIGIGFKLESDVAGPYNRTNGNILFAYHLLKNQEHNFSLGAVAGILNQRIDLTDKQLLDDRDPIISNNSGNASAFDGGPGLAYRYKKDNTTISFDFTLPQLFTSDLNYKNPLNLKHDNRPHVLAGLRYASQFGNIDIEPSLLFRATNGVNNILPLNTLDAALRTFFLDKQFWIGVGTRLNGNTSYAGLGITKDNIDFQGNFEYHNELGLTYELSLSYRFNAPTDTTDGKPNTLELEEINRNLSTLESSIVENDEVEERLTEVDKKILLADRKGVSKAAIAKKILDIEKSLDKAKTALNKVLNKSQSADNMAWRSERIIAEGEVSGTNNRQSKKAHSNNLELKDDLTSRTLENYDRYNTLLRSIQKIKDDNREPSIKELIRKENIKDIEAILNSRLSKVAGIDNESTINIVKKDKWRISYTFPHEESVYALNGRLNSAALMLEHIKQQINELNNQGIKIEAINLKFLLQDEIAYLKRKMSKYPYLGEFSDGESISLRHKATDTEAEISKAVKTEIKNRNETSLYQLACLKLIGIMKSIDTKYPVKFEIIAPDDDIDYSAVCLIEIVIK